MLADDLKALGSISATSKFISIEPTVLKFVWCQRKVFTQKKVASFFSKRPFIFFYIYKKMKHG